MVEKAFAMCCMFSGFACCGILFLISVILIPLGAINLEEANSANPDEDFQALAGKRLRRHRRQSLLGNRRAQSQLIVF